MTSAGIAEASRCPTEQNPIAVAVPAGNYRVTVTLGGVVSLAGALSQGKGSTS